MSMRRVKELMLRYGYQFRYLRNQPFEVPPGWFARFARLCEQVDVVLSEQEHTAFLWVDVRERQGSLRIYWAGHRSPLFFDQVGALTHRKLVEPETEAKIEALVRDAERDAEALCMFCGGPGALRGGAGWATTTCDAHRDVSFRFVDDLWKDEPEQS